MIRVLAMQGFFVAFIYKGDCSTKPSFSQIPPSVDCSPQGFTPNFVYDTGTDEPDQDLSVFLYFGGDKTNDLCSGVVNATSGDVTLTMDALHDSYNTTGYIGFLMTNETGAEVPRCGGVLEHWNDQNTEKIKYQVSATAIVTRTHRDKIERKTQYPFVIRCHLERRVGASTNNSFRQLQNVVDAADTAAVNNTINFAAALRFYKSENYTKPNNDLVLKPKNNEKLFIQVEQTANQHLFKFVVNKCYATLGSDPNSQTNYIFFDDQCSLDITVNFTTKDGNFQINILSFYFTGVNLEKRIWFHCDIFVCLTSNTDAACTQKTPDQCPAERRRRRSAPGSVLGEHMVSSSQAVVFDRSQGQAPACGDGFVYDRIHEECSNQHLLEMKGIHLIDEQYDPAYADTSSLSFKRLAAEKEQYLWVVLRVTGYHDTLQGVKVVKALQGSVILDVVVKYSDSVSETEAFALFKKVLQTPARVSRVMNLLKVQYVDKIERKIVVVGTAKENDKEKVAIIVVVVVILVVFFIAGITLFKVKQKRRVTPTS